MEFDDSRLVTAAVMDFKDTHGLSTGELADLLFMAHSTLYSKLNGARRWTTRDKKMLVSLGVRIPKNRELF